MANPSKSKGTSFENELLPRLRDIFGPKVDRAKANNPSCDFFGVPIPIEAKHRKAWNLRDWIRNIRIVAEQNPVYEPDEWVIFAADGDRRTKDSVGTVMVVDAEFGLRLLKEWWEVGVPAPRQGRYL